MATSAEGNISSRCAAVPSFRSPITQRLKMKAKRLCTIQSDGSFPVPSPCPLWLSRRPPRSLVGKAEVVQKRSIRRLLVVSVHLVVDCNAPPAARSRPRRILLVDVTGHTVQRDRLEQQRIVRLPLRLNGHVVPGVV